MTQTIVKNTINEGDILVAQWGYEANNVNYFKVLKRTKTFVEVAEVEAEYVPGDTGIYDGRYVQPSNTFKNWSLWNDGTRVDNGQPLVLRRKVKTHRDGGEYANLCEYAHMNIWNGRPQVDYNHH
jgi:hypothetical protein